MKKTDILIMTQGEAGNDASLWVQNVKVDLIS